MYFNFIFLFIYLFIPHIYCANACTIDEYYRKPVNNFIKSRDLEDSFVCEDDHFIVRDKFYIYINTLLTEFPMDKNYFLAGIVDRDLCQVNVMTGKLDWKSFQKCIIFFLYNYI